MKIHVIIIAFAITIQVQAQNTKTDQALEGIWDNGTGQMLVFEKSKKALWIFYNEIKRDTFKIAYTSNFTSLPHHLNLSDFQFGPLKGKTLFGIVEFTDDNTIRFDCEPGTSEAVRPKEFNVKQTQTYRRRK